MCATLAAVASICLRLSAQTAPATTAIVGGTVIDGSGGPPLADAVVLLSGGRITSVGARRAVTIPPDAAQIAPQNLFPSRLIFARGGRNVASRPWSDRGVPRACPGNF